jgi:hypothetical protein
LAEWLFEAGIGEDRAMLVDQDALELLIQRDDRGPQPGAVMSARLRGHRLVELEDGNEAWLDLHPARTTEGAVVRVLVTREALAEPGKPKRARARVVAADTPPAPALTLFERIAASGLPVTRLAPGAGAGLEDYGWSETIERAAHGVVPFASGVLRLSLTPAMTLIDIDGPGPVQRMAIEGVQAAARAIRLFGLAGSIGIDVPALADKAMRVMAAEAFAALAPRPFEATAINGFGFMQVVRPRLRASVPELVCYDAAGTAARALLRMAEWSGLCGPVVLTAAPAVIAAIADRPDWRERLSRGLGGAVRLRADAGLGIGAGHVHPDR